MKEIDINFSNKIKIGHADSIKKATGVTVILSEEGMNAGVCVAGGGPASREISLMDELTDEKQLNAVVLSGGSAFGLNASHGVVRYLADKNVGYHTPARNVPLVAQACLYDLNIGSPIAYPDEIMGYKACERAQENFERNYPPEQGNYGAGVGCTVGKLLGNDHMMKSGIGTYAVQVGDFKIGCIIAVNALGDVFDYPSGRPLAGLLDDYDRLISTRDTMIRLMEGHEFDNLKGVNTTIGCVIMNGKFNRTQLNKIAQMGQDGFALAINPVHTSMDGDTLFVVTDNEVEVSPDVAGTLASYVVAKAIGNAVKNTSGFYNLKTFKDVNGFWPY